MKDVLLGFSVCRNPRLADVFYRLDLIEAYGTGLRKIINAYPAYSPDKLLETTENVFKVTLPRLSSGAMLRESQGNSYEETVLFNLPEGEAMTRARVEQLTGLSQASASRLLRRMVEEGKLKVSGLGKSTRYSRP